MIARLLEKPKDEWDELDLYDREAAEIRRALEKIDLDQWCKDLKSLDPELFDKIYKRLHQIYTQR